MLFTSKELSCAAYVSDHLQFMQDLRRHDLPVEDRRFRNKDTYDLSSFAVSMVVDELRKYGNSLSRCGRLLSPIDLDELSHCKAKLRVDEIDDLIVWFHSAMITTKNVQQL